MAAPAHTPSPPSPTDITAPAPTVGDGKDTPEGLVELFEHEWEEGAIITREQLEQVCR